MGKSIPAEIVVEFDDSGGVLRNITQFVQSIGDFDIEQLLEDSRTFGDSWDEFLAIGIAKVAALDIGGQYDDAANGPDAVFRITAPDTPASITRTLKITWKTTGGTKSTAIETLRKNYKATPDRNGLTKYTATVQPTGATTEV